MKYNPLALFLVIFIAGLAQTTFLAGLVAVFGLGIPLMLTVLILLGFILDPKSFLAVTLGAGLWRDLLSFAPFGQWLLIYLLLFGLFIAIQRLGLHLDNKPGFLLILALGVSLELVGNIAVSWLQAGRFSITPQLLLDFVWRFGWGIVLAAGLWLPLKYLLKKEQGQAWGTQ